MPGRSITRTGAIIPDAVYYENDELDIFEEYDGVQLTPDEISFVNFYCGDARYSATKAYEMMRGRSMGQYGRAQASKWMHKAHVQKAIKYRLDAAGATAEAALAELAEVAFADFHDFIDVKMRNGEVLSVRMDLGAKVKALQTIVQVHGLLEGNKTNNGVVVNINAPGLTKDELA